MTELNAKPINFKFGEYLSNGFEFLKNNFGNLLLALFFSMIMSFIPLCSFLALGNFNKYCRGLRRGERVSPSDIFNFDNFSAYLILQLIIIGAVILFYIPIIFMIPFLVRSGESDPSVGFFIFFIIYIIILFVALFILSLKGFYITALISLGGIRDIKTAWKMSVVMSRGNLLSIFLFSFVISILGQLGILACGIGLIFSIPYVYTANYFAFEDAMQQIEHDEIKEIGVKNEY